MNVTELMHTAIDVSNLDETTILSELENPGWGNRPSKWRLFVPIAFRDRWGTFSLESKLLIFSTAAIAAESHSESLDR